MALQELAKTCKFCSEECTAKVRDQIIEDISDILKHLLQQSNLTLDMAITTC